ncbi:hypothetical protein HNQ91_003394 [Filimonas zeae]|uniref:Uncharacterized protein n=1 Tax=Filimonas zeae TaxID=1737353 RepID=A0A917J1H4_9BACT|nr:hypothetical protein [Filimonas zeae]MDR6340329.1 hypothetical protein [Filimonas zeae]GGH72230.1 hypothetical protein GCM10011379_32410 [Filimonas zeae]
MKTPSPQHTNTENATHTSGIVSANPLQMLTAGEETETKPVKHNPFLRITESKGTHNPLQLLKQTVVTSGAATQLISDFSRAVLEQIVIPVLENAAARYPDLPAMFNPALAALRGCLMDDDDKKGEAQVAEEAIAAFFGDAFERYRLTPGLEIVGTLRSEIVTKINIQLKNPLLAQLDRQHARMQRAKDTDGYVEIDPATVNKNMPAPQPLLRGLIWNLHGFSNVINNRDRADFRVIGGGRHNTRKGMVNELIGSVGNKMQGNNPGLDAVTAQETEVMFEMWKLNTEQLESVASPLLTREQIKAVFAFVRKMNKNFTDRFFVREAGKYRIAPLYRVEVIEALENYQKILGDDQKKTFNAIDKLLNQLRANEVVHQLKNNYGFITTLLQSFQNASLPPDGDEPALLHLISRVKELRQVIKALSTFQLENATNPLHQALGNLSKALNALINRKGSEEYRTDDMNLAVYLDKELNKYAIVSHLTSLLANNQLNLDFMLLNEMNRGILSFTSEVDRVTQHKYGVAQGPQMAAMNKEGQGTQREYYPLVYDKQKFDHKGYFYVGVQRTKTVSNRAYADDTIEWMKPEKRKKLPSGSQQQTEGYLDYRPIIVHRLTRKNAIPLPQQPQQEIWLAAVHTTPYGNEFDRQKIFKELEGPLKTLKTIANDRKAELIIGGDFYIAAEALAKVPDGDKMAGSKQQNAPGRLEIDASVGDQNQNRNLRTRNGEVSSFTKHLSGDSFPTTGWKGSNKNMGLADIRSITGTNKNSKGLQSADYFVLPGVDAHRVRVGLIDPRTKAIVELETDEKQISKHNFFFSDHLISAIEKYATREDKEKAQVHGRLNMDKLDMIPENLTALKSDSRALKYDVGDFEPQPGTASIITTVLFRVWNRIKTELDRNNNIAPHDLQKWGDLLVWIDTTRQRLKKRFYSSGDKENMNELIAVLQSLGDASINEQAALVQSMIDHFPEKHETGDGDTFTTGVDARTLKSDKVEITSPSHYPSWQELPATVQKAFGENLQLTTSLNAGSDTEAIINALQYHSEPQVQNLLAALRKTRSIDHPEVIRLIGAAGFSIYVYRLVFMKQESKKYVNVLKYRYGRGLPLELRILEISSGIILPPFIFSGYYQLGK